MKFLEKVNTTFPPVVVFGASILGKIVLDSLDILNVRPVCFCDNDLKKQRELFHGYEVISLEKLCIEHPEAIVIIAADRYFDEINQQLIEADFKNIFSDADVISCIDFNKISSKRLKNIIWHLAKLEKLSEIWEQPGSSFNISRLNVVVTSRCTLSCEHCSSLMPYYKKQSDFDTSKILASLDRIISCVDLIYHVELLGGEPFLNKNLPQITKHLLDSGKILHIDIITNGTILPSDRILEKLKHDSISVVIDDYGKLSRKTNVLSNSLKRLGIDSRVNKHWAWADLGGFELRKYSDTHLTNLFSNCNFNSCTELLDGILYRCPRSSHGTKTKLIPEYKMDFVQLLDPSENDDLLSERISSFMKDKKFIFACDHCNGNTIDSLTLTPAEQQTFIKI